MEWNDYIDEGMLHAEEVDFETCSHGAIKPTYFIRNGEDEYVLQTVQQDEEHRLYMVRHLLDRLEETPVPAPTVAFDGSARAVPFYVMDRVQGINPEDDYNEMEEEERLRIVEQAGYHLGEAHNVLDADGYGELDAQHDSLQVEHRENWRDFFVDRMQSKISYLDELEDDEDLVADAYRTVDRAKQFAPREPEPGILHLDYRPGNLIIEDGDVAAVLDWDNAIAGDQFYDYVKAEASFTDRLDTPEEQEAVRDQFRQGYERAGRTVEEDERYRFYRFCSALSKTKALRYVSRQYGEEHDELAEQFREQLERRQEELQDLLE
ncbi:MAG: phosphotransferase [Candidatus Nanohaloarchaea archaeon]|nr:phosphotransferase [Candidatus Nanohaloarchaea archaeon]